MELHRERKVYFQNVLPVMRHVYSVVDQCSRFRSAVYLAQRLVDFQAASEDLFWLAEAYRTPGACSGYPKQS